MTLKFRTILIATIASAIGASAIFFDAWRTRQWYIDEATRDAQSFVAVLDDSTARTFEGIDRALDAMAANPGATLHPRADGLSIAETFKRRLRNLPQLLWFSAWDAEGNLIASSSPNASAVGNISQRSWFTQAISGNGGIGPLTKAQMTSASFIPLTRTLRGTDDKVRAIVMAALDSHYLADIYSHADVRSGGNVTLFDTAGTIIARFPDNDGFVGRSTASGQLFKTYLPKASSGVVRLTTVLDPHDILLAYRTVANYPLVINVAFDVRDILVRWQKSLPIYGLLCLAILILPLTAAFAFIRASDGAKALVVAQKETELALVRQREIGIVQRRLSNAERIANLGNWHWNMETNELSWSDQIYRIFGLEPQEFGANYNAFLDYVHPDDRVKVEESVRQSIEAGAPYAIDHRIVRADGAIRIVHEQGEIVRDPMGRALRMNGVVQDVTDLRKAEAEHLKSEMRLSGILSIAPEAIIAVDMSGNIQLFNSGAEQIFGYTADAVIGRSLGVLLPERARAHHHAMMQAFGNSTEPSRLMSRRGRISGRRKDGTEFPAEASIAKLDVAGEKIFTVILRDITARVEEERALIAAKEAAESANRAKSQFLANMSHELRTPLNAIIGFSEMMTRRQLGPLGNKRYEQYAADICDSGKHLLDVINDVLDVAKIEASEMNLYETPLNLERLAHRCLDLLKMIANSKGVTVSIDANQAMPKVLADKRKVKQIVINLLSNAIKFTPKGGTVTVRVAIGRNGEPMVVVADTGIGIPSERLPHIGQPFVQVEGGLNRRFEGTGLGLALSKALVELHGGTLTVESEVGHGTTVTVRLPPNRVIEGERGLKMSS